MVVRVRVVVVRVSPFQRTTKEAMDGGCIKSTEGDMPYAGTTIFPFAQFETDVTVR